MSKLNIFWFRRDLRLYDNCGLFHALQNTSSVQPIFIFDSSILKKLPANDARVSFIYQQVENLRAGLQGKKSDLWVFHGEPEQIFKKLTQDHQIESVFTNEDYEPYARKRDQKIQSLLKENKISFLSFKDQVIFAKDEVLTDTKKPYTVFTPYKNKWLAQLKAPLLQGYDLENFGKKWNSSLKSNSYWLSLKDLGFQKTKISFPSMELNKTSISNYDKTRNFPSLEGGTSHLGLHFRFGTISPREMVKEARKLNETWLSELIWREFFMQILWHYPQVVTQSFRKEYDQISWRDSKKDFQKWCDGMTGYPLVDAGMRELNQTGSMHNRVRMVAASFLTKHLLIHWSQGEAYFAEKLLDYDLSANNGNWQWAAGSGCDAAPYFRIFNPQTQFEKFDKDEIYVKKWVPEYGTDKYPEPMVDHNEARGRALQEYGKVLKKGIST